MVPQIGESGRIRCARTRHQGGRTQKQTPPRARAREILTCGKTNYCELVVRPGLDRQIVRIRSAPARLVKSANWARIPISVAWPEMRMLKTGVAQQADGRLSASLHSEPVGWSAPSEGAPKNGVSIRHQFSGSTRPRLNEPRNERFLVHHWLACAMESV